MLSADLCVGDFLVRPTERRVYLHGRPVVLGARAFDLLLALIEHRDRVVGKDELMALVWPALVVEEGNLAVQVSALRKLLGSKAIATVPGRGYRFTARVVEKIATNAREQHTEPELREPVTTAPAAAAEHQTYERLMHKLRSPSIEQGLAHGPAAEFSGWMPAAMTPLLGRASALAETQLLLQSSRCLTLTGAGGSGKTRLALALAEAVRMQYPGGVWWVGLDTLGDPGLLAATLAGVVGGCNLRLPALQGLAERLKGRKTLLVLDNCEHLVEGCADLAARLVRELPLLHLLNTSRESLRIAGEIVWSVPPLDVPDAADERHLDQLMQHGSVQLLIQRIRQHSPGFVLTEGNAARLVQICRGLDGLPLALELVAAQVGPRTLDQVAARLDRSLPLLRVGQRGGMRHHQTMAAAVDWGLRLLDDADRAVFLRLSVFVGGCTSQSAAAACEGLGIGAEDLVEVTGRLVRASMVQALHASGDDAADAAVRLRMLEPIRQFAFAQLEALGQVDAVKRQLLAWYLDRCKSVASQLTGPRQAQGYAFLVSEFDNLRELLTWSKNNDVAGGLRLAADLWRFWQVKGHAKQMLEWFEEVLTLAHALPDPLRADASNAAGVMARTCGHYATAVRLHEAALALQRQLGNRRGEAIVLNNLCVIARDQYDHPAVERHGRASLAIAREIGDRNLEGLGLMHLGTALRGQDRAAAAQATFRQSFAIFSELGEKRALGTLLNFLGNLALADGRWPEAERCFDEGLELNRELEDFWGLGISTCNLAALCHARGDAAAALEMLLRSLAYYRRAGARHGVEECFELLARLARQRGQLERAAWCWGVVEQLEQDTGKRLAQAVQARRAQALRELKSALPDELFSSAWAQGLGVPLDDAFGAVLPDGGMD
jgi:predicted ATPase/DNA-binding winged helix-turn-helix (wHTH) protein